MMSAKPTVPCIATFAPPLLVGTAIYFVLQWLLSADDAPNKGEMANRGQMPESSGMQGIPPNSGGKFATTPGVSWAAPALVPSVSAGPMPKTSAPAFAVCSKSPAPAQASPPNKRRAVTREDLAAAFHHGAGTLTRTAAVDALKSLGFGKTAAYAALAPDGRFSHWMQFAPDGKITWKS